MKQRIADACEKSDGEINETDIVKAALEQWLIHGKVKLRGKEVFVGDLLVETTEVQAQGSPTDRARKLALGIGEKNTIAADAASKSKRTRAQNV